MDRVRQIFHVFDKSYEDSRWMVIHFSIPKELSLNLDMEVRVIVCVQSWELNRVPISYRVFAWSALIIVLSNLGAQLLHNTCLHFKSFVHKDLLTVCIFKLEHYQMAGPWEVDNFYFLEFNFNLCVSIG